jgi:phenylalanyl-tRNA synthetase beta chain
VNFSFVAPGDVQAFDPAAKPIGLANPITAELAVMRTSLVPSLLRNAGFNLRMGAESGRLYEIARVFAPRSGADRDPPADERLRIGAVLFGRRHPHHVDVADAPVDFLDAKGAAEGVLAALAAGPSAGSLRWRAAGSELAWLHPRSACVVERDGARLGWLGELHPRVAAAFELPRGVLVLELDAEALLAGAALVARHRPVSRLPGVTRDIAVLVDETVPAGEIQRVIDAEGGGLLEESTIYDDFRGGQVPPGKKNLAVYLRWRALDRTLTDEEADGLRARIIERLRNDAAIRAELRG